MSASLARPEIAALTPYVTAAQKHGTLRLNANEAPDAPLDNGLNRYPPIRPQALQARLAQLFGVDAANLLVTRGSSEAIDLLIRTFCRAYTDSIVITPPSFSMYPVYARMQGASVIDVPLDANDGFRLDTDALLAACTDNSKLIFICSPNNPTGNSVPLASIETLLQERAGRSLIVVDEAYIEFSAAASLVTLLARHDNLVVLRTLSKAWGLAGSRCGAVAADAKVIDVLARMLPPYAFSSPATERVLASLSTAEVERARDRIATIVAERERLRTALAALECVRTVWPSDSNFLLVQFDDLSAVQAHLERHSILIRAFDSNPALAQCARITVGAEAENQKLLVTLGTLEGTER